MTNASENDEIKKQKTNVNRDIRRRYICADDRLDKWLLNKSK